MMNEDQLSLDFVAGVVEHMNADHADAVLNIARTFGGFRYASAASMTGLDTHCLYLEVQADGQRIPIQVPLPRTVAGPAEVRQVLVEFARLARAELGQ